VFHLSAANVHFTSRLQKTRNMFDCDALILDYLSSGDTVDNCYKSFIGLITVLGQNLQFGSNYLNRVEIKKSKSNKRWVIDPLMLMF
jgi:hypothetical protein